DWNDLDIIVTAPTNIAKVNGKVLESKDVFELSVKDGKPVAKLNGESINVGQYQYQANVCTALCKNNGEILEKAFPVPQKGGIGLQAETGKFEYRRVRIKELP